MKFVLRALLGVVLGFGVVGCPAPTPPAPRRDVPHPRVITSSPAVAELVCALGAQAHLVGVSRYCTHPPELADLPQIGGLIDPNLEAIDSLEPDLVFTQGADANLDALAELRGFERIPYQIESIDDLCEVVEDLGQRLGRETEAAAEVVRLRAALAAPAEPTGPRVLLVIGHRPGELGQVLVPGAGTFLSECLRAAGGRVAVADLPRMGWHTVAQEVYLEAAPARIVELHTEPVDDATRAALVADWEALGVTAPVSLVVHSGLLIPGPRLDEVVEVLRGALREAPR